MLTVAGRHDVTKIDHRPCVDAVVTTLGSVTTTHAASELISVARTMHNRSKPIACTVLQVDFVRLLAKRPWVVWQSIQVVDPMRNRWSKREEVYIVSHMVTDPMT